MNDFLSVHGRYLSFIIKALQNQSCFYYIFSIFFSLFKLSFIFAHQLIRSLNQEKKIHAIWDASAHHNEIKLSAFLSLFQFYSRYISNVADKLGLLYSAERFLLELRHHTADSISASQGGCPRGVMVKAMDCKIVVCEFVLQSRYYVHFRANTLGKGMNPLILPAMG